MAIVVRHPVGGTLLWEPWEMNAHSTPGPSADPPHGLRHPNSFPFGGGQIQ